MTTLHPVYDEAYFKNGWTSKTKKAAEQYVQILRRHTGGGRANVLDVGCGVGVVLDELRAESAWHSFGVDISIEALRQGTSSPKLGVVAADAARLPFADDAFDAVLLLDVIEHVLAPPIVLDELRRISRPGATLIVTTPNSSSVLRPLLGARWHGVRILRISACSTRSPSDT